MSLRVTGRTVHKDCDPKAARLAATQIAGVRIIRTGLDYAIVTSSNEEAYQEYLEEYRIQAAIPIPQKKSEPSS